MGVGRLYGTKCSHVERTAKTERDSQSRIKRSGQARWVCVKRHILYNRKNHHQVKVRPRGRERERERGEREVTLHYAKSM